MSEFAVFQFFEILSYLFVLCCVLAFYPILSKQQSCSWLIHVMVTVNA